MRQLCLAVCASALLVSAARAQNCANTSIGSTPLNDLAGGSYQGFAGGLYPGGSNALPPRHLVGGLRQALQVVPRDAAGNPDPNGKIGFISLGMSNTRNHFQAFTTQTQADALRDPRVVVVNTAQGGQPAEDVDDPSAPYWDFVDARLAQAEVSAQQVQVLWMLQANRSPQVAFPAHAEGLRDQLAVIARIAKDRFPNARLLYLGARIYAGYATGNLNPEPYAYEQGFANKWLIEDQFAGDPGLEYRPGQVVEAPWIAWGPYMWADGLTPRSDGLVWECSDLAPDGTHPSAQGAAKVAAALVDFVHSDPTAASWYLAEPGPVVYGTAKINSLALRPSMSWSGAPRPGGSFVVRAYDGLPGKFALGIVSTTPAAVPFFGGTRWVGPFQRLGAATFDHAAAVAYDIPVGPGLVGATRFYQVLSRDPQDPSGVSNTDGLKVVFLP